MSLKLIDYSPGICVRCGGEDGPEVQPGGSVKVYLNQTRVPDYPEYIMGVVTGIAQASATDTTRTYTVQYESTDLGETATELAECDITSLICESCCDELAAMFAELRDADRPFVTLTYYWNESGEAVLLATAYSRIPGVTITAYGWASGNDAFTPSGPVTQNYTIVPGSDAADFEGGRHNVTVTDSAGHVSEANVYVYGGKYLSSLVVVGSAIALTNNTPADVTSLVLTPGDWDVEGNINVSYAGATMTARSSGISLTSVTLPTDGSEVRGGLNLTTATTIDGSTIPRKRISVTEDTTVYLVVSAAFSAGTAGAYGSLTARKAK